MFVRGYRLFLAVLELPRRAARYPEVGVFAQAKRSCQDANGRAVAAWAARKISGEISAGTDALKLFGELTRVFPRALESDRNAV